MADAIFDNPLISPCYQMPWNPGWQNTNAKLRLHCFTVKIENACHQAVLTMLVPFPQLQILRIRSIITYHHSLTEILVRLLDL